MSSNQRILRPLLGILAVLFYCRCCYLPPAFAQQNVFRLVRLNAASNSKYIPTLNVSYNGTNIDMDCDVVQPIGAPLELHVNVLARNRERIGNEDDTYFSLVNQTVDYCALLANPVLGGGLLETIYNGAQSTENHSFGGCPIAKGHYFVKHLTWDMDKLPQSLPGLYFTLLARVSQPTNAAAGSSDDGNGGAEMMFEYRAVGQIGRKQSLAKRNRKPTYRA